MLTETIHKPMTSVIAANANESEWPADESVGKVRVCPLEYWLEQQVNINVFRLFVKRPDSLPDAVAQALPAILLDGSNKMVHGQTLVFERTRLRIAFLIKASGSRSMTAPASSYELDIDFSHCEIDPEKCTVDMLDNHWVFRLSFYYPGSISRPERSTLSLQKIGGEMDTLLLPRRKEGSPYFSCPFHCSFCEAMFVPKDSFASVKRAPSPYWSSLSHHWYCLQSMGAKRLEEMAPGGQVRVEEQMLLVDQESVVMRTGCIVEGSIERTQVVEDQDDSADELLDGNGDVNKIVLCARCTSPVGREEHRHGFPIVRFYKHCLQEFAHMTPPGKEERSGGSAVRRNDYTVDSVVGHIMVNAFLGRNTRKFVVHGLSSDRGICKVEGPRIRLVLFDPDVRGCSEETPAFREAIKVLYAAVEPADSGVEKRTEAHASTTISMEERLLLSEESCDSLWSRLEASNGRFPTSMAKMKFREEMKLGILWW